MASILQKTRPPTNKYLRVNKSMWRQGSLTIICPEKPDMAGKRVLVTGGLSGVGQYVSEALLARGADVTTLARGVSAGSKTLSGVTALQADLADPSSICAALSVVTAPFDCVICNAGINVTRYETTDLGVEKAFGVNVLGHHVLYRYLQDNGLLQPGARIIMTTGDIYVLAGDCTPDFTFRAGPMAYARSKLGNLWQMAELNSRYPDVNAFAVHPGVVASGFAGAKTGIVGALKNKIFVSEQQGAQTALIAATQDIARGTYIHNVMGRMDLRENDVALDRVKSAQLWDTLETLVVPFLQAA